MYGSLHSYLQTAYTSVSVCVLWEQVAESLHVLERWSPNWKARGFDTRAAQLTFLSWPSQSERVPDSSF